MAIIKQLDPHVADLIAAGEVVERPLSVVKELIENALDAEARGITVEIQGGGLTYIRTTDDGAGMEVADAKLAFHRHATSKLETGRDLESIGTLGFRGEALAAISAVSRIDLLTRKEEAQEGVSVTVEAGQVISVSPVGCPVGTTMVVRDLFFNTPARLKFMKSDRAEAAAITAMMTSMALSHPAVSFRYIRDGKEEFHTPGDGNIQSVIYTLLGREFAKGLIEIKSQDEGVSVTGFATAPAHARGSRSQQHFFVNGRYIRSRALQTALEQAYKNVQFTGKFPGCVLYLTLPYGTVDVNVHPTKTEVKFLYEKQVFDAVYYGVLDALEKSSYMPEITLSRGTERALGTASVGAGSARPSIPAENPVGRDALGASLPQHVPAAEPVTVRVNAGAHCAPLQGVGSGVLQDTPAVLYQSRLDLPEAISFRVVGETLGTYILVEQGDELLFIDKHAAHERILFDQLRAERYAPMAQTLLVPVTVDLGAEVTAILMDHGAELEALGFEIDQFGTGTVALRQVPGDIDLDDMEPFLAELARGLRLGKSPELNTIRDEVLHTMACKAAIKAGRRSDPLELYNLAERVLSGEAQYCPHGRPVSLRLTRGELDKQVRRS